MAQWSDGCSQKAPTAINMTEQHLSPTGSNQKEAPIKLCPFVVPMSFRRFLLSGVTDGCLSVSG